ncbi:DMT family transporter [Dolosicoccus paucivorans]
MNHYFKGITLAVTGGTLWGLSGVVAQLLFTNPHLSAEWLISTRLFMAGLMILTYAFIKKESIFTWIYHKQDRRQLIIFSIFGMSAMQYTFFKAIQFTDASTATILQYTAPIFIFLFLVLTRKKVFNMTEFFLIILTLIGIVLITTNGQLDSLTISPRGFLTGVSSAIALAFYLLYPRRIMTKYGTLVVAGWGMLIGGMIFQLFSPFWQPNVQLTQGELFSLIFVITLGTAVPFIVFLSSLNYLPVTLASVLSALEPIVATIFSVWLFHRHFQPAELMGIVLVLITITLLSVLDAKKVKPTSTHRQQ